MNAGAALHAGVESEAIPMRTPNLAAQVRETPLDEIATRFEHGLANSTRTY